jgi:hypothetical protein
LVSSFLDTYSGCPQNTTFIFFGFGFGYHLEYFLSRVPSSFSVFCYEPIQQFYQEDLFLHRISSMEAVYPNVKIASKPVDILTLSANRIFFVHPYYEKNYKEELDRFIDRLSLPVSIQKKTEEHFSKLWLRNFCIHIQKIQLQKKIAFLKQNSFDWKNKDVLFVGAAPLLEEQIKTIRQNQHRYIILSSDTSIHYLLYTGVPVDAIVSIDAGRGTYYHLRSNIPQHIPFFTWLGGNRLIWELKNPIYVYLSTYPPDQVLQTILGNQYPTLENPSLNVAGLAKALAYTFGSPRFVLAGVNFQSVGTKTHCRGTGYESYYMDKTSRYKPLEGFRAGSYEKEKMSSKNKNSWNAIWKQPDNMEICEISQIEEKTNGSPKDRLDRLSEQEHPNLVELFVETLQNPTILKTVSKELKLDAKTIENYIRRFL